MMSQKCKCKTNWTTTAREYKNKVHSKIYDLIIFQAENDYFYYKRKNIYYVAPLEKHLRHMDYYNSLIEEFTEKEFKNYFII